MHRGVASDVDGHCLYEGPFPSAIALAAQLLHQRKTLAITRPSERNVLLHQSVRAVGLSALSGAGFSLVISLSLALIPGGKLWLLADTVGSATRLLTDLGDKAFELKTWGSR